MTALQPGDCRRLRKIFRIMLTAAASNHGETCRRAHKSGSRLTEKPAFVEPQRSTPQRSRNFSGYIAPQLSGKSGASPFTAN
ncbi:MULTISPECIES: hypothetical protein [unclassified Mesorhizobium]|uniref:hypothetical protein n=1 Tax=unclassified Mesorhizobium TaxID=325217 RepID=UPI00112DED95|nr:MULTISPECIES: hypothetical protein [unclassified Mesorhizobium]TPI17426.1 hypothetical protein FJW10_22490 [Mesorhizobium sp. B4-1-1]TPL47542.1 hypothetical protein FJ957_16365 [Mesorhizobium sp. B2-4-6]